ncbi:MAG: hypothetical protein Q9M28_03735 [Mariprofundaceae bacterium]|nr:hypothetical protein [Mariprofundaceae bacterium]
MLKFFLRMMFFSITLGAFSTVYASEGFIVKWGDSTQAKAPN